MAGDTTKRGPAHRSRVDINQDHEVRYWTEEIGCTATQLREAVRAVGPMVRNIREHLKKAEAA
jgi:hypothetical protein